MRTIVRRETGLVCPIGDFRAGDRPSVSNGGVSGSYTSCVEEVSEAEVGACFTRLKAGEVVAFCFGPGVVDVRAPIVGEALIDDELYPHVIALSLVIVDKFALRIPGCIKSANIIN